MGLGCGWLLRSFLKKSEGQDGRHPVNAHHRSLQASLASHVFPAFTPVLS